MRKLIFWNTEYGEAWLIDKSHKFECLKKKTNGVAWLLDEPHKVETSKEDRWSDLLDCLIP